MQTIKDMAASIPQPWGVLAQAIDDNFAEIGSGKATMVYLGEYKNSGGGETAAAQIQICSDPSINLMTYRVTTGNGANVIMQQVRGARCQQILFFDGQMFTRSIGFNDESRTRITSVGLWNRTMPTNLIYNQETHRIRMVDYNTQHSLPLNDVNNDGVAIPSATISVDGLMTKEQVTTLNQHTNSINTLFGLTPIVCDGIVSLVNVEQSSFLGTYDGLYIDEDAEVLLYGCISGGTMKYYVNTRDDGPTTKLTKAGRLLLCEDKAWIVLANGTIRQLKFV